MSKLRPLTIEPTPSAPLPDSKSEQPPLIRRAEVVAIALVGLLAIAIAASLYLAKAFFLPVVTAFIVGTMLAPMAGYLERHRIPRPISAVLIVVSACGGLALIVSLITAPIMEWATRLPELGEIVKAKMHHFDRPVALWHQFQALLGNKESLSTAEFELPKIDWMKPTLEVLSPSVAEFLLFAVTLLLFIASWPDLRRKMTMTFADRDARLRTLRILNAIETSLGGYLLMVTMINCGVGVATGLICAVTGMPNPAGLGALAAVLNFFPIIGPMAMFVVLCVVGFLSFDTLGAGLLAAAGFVGMTFFEGHFITPTIIGRRLELNALAVVIALAFWTWLWGPMGGFIASPLLIVALVLNEHLRPDTSPRMPDPVPDKS